MGGPGGQLPPPRDIVIKTQQQQTSSWVPTVAQALQKYVALTDDAVAVELVKDCQGKVSDATLEEILHFIEIKAELMLRMTTVRNPIGFLRHSVPKCFEGLSFQQYRNIERRRREALEHDNRESDRAAKPAIESEGPNPQSVEPRSHDLVSELVNRGISERQAENLVAEVPSDQNISEQIEYGDYLIGRRPESFRNPPGFYISLIKDNVVPPTTFETRQRRQAREARERKLHDIHFEEQQLRFEYENVYREKAIESYIKQHLSQDEYNHLLEEYKRKYKREWPRLSDETITDIAHGKIRGHVEPDANLLTFEAWKNQAKPSNANVQQQ